MAFVMDTWKYTSSVYVPDYNENWVDSTLKVSSSIPHVTDKFYITKIRPKVPQKNFRNHKKGL